MRFFGILAVVNALTLTIPLAASAAGRPDFSSRPLLTSNGGGIE